MTIVAYYKDHLIADKMAIAFQGTHYEHKVLDQKLHVSACQTLAFASCGTSLAPSDMRPITKCLLRRMKQMYQLRIPPMFDESEEFFLGFKTRSFIVMTKDFCIAIDDSKVTTIESGEVVAFGTGAMMMFTLANADVTINEAVPLISKFVPTVSKEYDKILRDELKPFIVEDKVT